MPTEQEIVFAGPAGGAQEQFFLAQPGGPCLFLGGFGSGKSTTLVIKLLWILSAFPGAQGALIRRNANALRITTLKTLLHWLPPEQLQSINHNDGIIKLANGSTLYLLHVEDEASVGKLKSLELNVAAIDQAEEIMDPGLFDVVDARVGRWRITPTPQMLAPDWPWRDETGFPLPPSWTLLSANSPGHGHWLETRFSDDSEEKAKWRALGYRLFTASSRENQFLGRDNLAKLLSMGESFARRYVDPAWGAVEGAIFQVSNLSILHPDPELLEKIKRTMKLHRSLDHGATSPTCCLWEATDSDGNIFVYREYYQADTLISDHRKNITRLSGHEKYASQLADPSIFYKTGQLWNIADEYMDRKVLGEGTVIAWSPAQNEEEPSRARLQEYLRVDPDWTHPITRQKGSPRLFFVMKGPGNPNGCDQSVKQLRAQRLEKIGEGPAGGIFSDERDDTVVDHAYDALKYFVVSRPPVPLLKGPAKYDTTTWQGYANWSAKKRRERASMGAFKRY